MNTSWTSSAAAMSRDAATQPVGTRRPTSSAWEGPERATTRHLPPSSSPITWVRHRAVSFSMPLATLTTTASCRSRGAALLAVARTAKEGVAITTSSLSPRASMELVRWSASGRGTPLSMGFSRFSRSTLHSSSMKDQSVTSLPLSSSSSARAVPQPPEPNTVIFIAKTPPIPAFYAGRIYFPCPPAAAQCWPGGPTPPRSRRPPPGAAAPGYPGTRTS